MSVVGQSRRFRLRSAMSAMHRERPPCRTVACGSQSLYTAVTSLIIAAAMDRDRPVADCKLRFAVQPCKALSDRRERAGSARELGARSDTANVGFTPARHE